MHATLTNMSEARLLGDYSKQSSCIYFRLSKRLKYRADRLCTIMGMNRSDFIRKAMLAYCKRCEAELRGLAE